ncbi:MAG: type II secretion system F family protein, partial [Planctomycetota bacterium]
MSQLTFRYTAIDQRGAKTTGTLQAASPSEAYRQISASGMKPLKLKARGGRGGWNSRKVGVRDLAHLTYQFAVLMEARIPIAEGLRSIAEQEHNERLREVILDVAGQIEAGYSVTDAMSQHADLFGEVYIETVRAAENSGNMVKVLSRLAEMLERRYETDKAIRGAMIYPACVLVAMTLAVVFLLIFIVPKFSGLYARQNLDLPLPTQVLIGSSAFVRTYWHILSAGLFGG